MNILVYFFVALIAAGSVLFGLDVVTAPMSPMPASKYALRAAVPPAPPAPAVAKLEPKTEAAASAAVTSPGAAAPIAPPAAPAAVAPVAAAPVAIEQPAPIAAIEPVAAAPKPAPRCDVDACASAYRSFTEADCTYQPSDGPRRLCTKGTPPASTVPTAAAPAVPPDARAQACNVAACARSYPRSFSAADCTFLPAEGPRRVCTK